MATKTPLTDAYEQSLGMESGFDSNFARKLELDLAKTQTLLNGLLEDLRRIDKTATLPDGDGVNMSVVTWASEWIQQLTKQGD